MKQKNSIVEAFGMCSTMGISRNYNEDKTSIILDIIRKNNLATDKENLETDDDKESSGAYFSIFDGHGGHKCANYLKENLHNYIINDSNFFTNCEQAMKNGILKAENYFLSRARNSSTTENSGSCIIIALFIEDFLYISNVGDSRCISSINKGANRFSITNDHKPGCTKEHERILKAGGKVYRNNMP